MARMDRLAQHVYDMEHGPLFTAELFRLSDDHHVLLIGLHHIIFDAWSLLNVMSREIQALYVAHREGRPANLPELPVQYADFAVWERQQDLSPHLAYWMEALRGYQQGLDLPYDYQRPQNRAWHASTLTVRYPDTLAKAFARFNESHQATLFMGLLCSVAILIGRYSGKNDVCIGTTTGARGHVELEHLIGFFINILPIRIDLSQEEEVSGLMRLVRRKVLDAFEHQSLPFEHLLNALHMSRDSSQIPLVPVIVRHQNFPVASTGDWSDELKMETISRDERTTPTEIDMQFYGDGSTLEVTVEYAAELFSEATIRRMISHHRKVLEFMVESMSEENASV